MSPASDYRPDIDGLRALAVVAVVMHHYVPRLFPGGYVGVDVFFVISGYLITRILRREMEHGDFSLAGFYERRIRRIFPALFAVLAAVLAAGYFLLLPSDYLATFRAALGTALFSANLVFWRDLQEGYFAADAKLNPLLHMWSLGVEEQFYLGFPLLLLLCMRYCSGMVLRVLLVLAVISLAAAAWALGSKPVAAFFLIPFRAWELLAGAALAFLALQRPQASWSREAMAGMGLLGIVLPIFFYDPATPFPALAAMPPVLGAVLLIRAGEMGATRAGGWLRWRPVVYIGLISYSLYLWHWPLLVFARFWNGLQPIGPWTITALLATSLLVAGASYRFIERPFRRAGRSAGPRPVLGMGVAAMALFVAVSAVGTAKNGGADRFDHSVVELDRTRTDSIPYRSCESRIGKPTGGLCVIGSESEAPEVLLWGDSHMLAWLPAFDVALRQMGRSALAAPNAACPPILGVTNLADAACRDQNLAVMETLSRHPRVGTVVMAGFWSAYFQDSNLRLASVTGQTGNPAVTRPAFEATLETLSHMNRRVVVLGPVPTYPIDVPLALAQGKVLGRETITPLSLRQVHEKQPEFYDAVRQAAAYGILFFDVATWMCQPGCETNRNGVSLYRDADHLSKQGALLLAPNLMSALETSLNPNPSLRNPLQSGS